MNNFSIRRNYGSPVWSSSTAARGRSASASLIPPAISLRRMKKKKGGRCTEGAHGDQLERKSFQLVPFPHRAPCVSRLPPIPTSPPRRCLPPDPVPPSFHFLPSSDSTRLPLLVDAHPPNFAPFEIERIAGESRKELPIEYATLCNVASVSGCDCSSDRADSARVTRFSATRGFPGETVTNGMGYGAE